MREIPTLNINMDDACPRCGKGGSVNGGLCMECVTKEIKRRGKMEGKKIKKHLKCVLTQDEVRELGGDLARLYSEITDLEEQKKAVASDFKSRIDSSTAQATGVARKIQNGYEFRDVECSVETDYVKGEVHIIRDDTGEIVDTRNMTQEERQEKMFPED